jgi:hypothetical protein
VLHFLIGCAVLLWIVIQLTYFISAIRESWATAGGCGAVTGREPLATMRMKPTTMAAAV